MKSPILALPFDVRHRLMNDSQVFHEFMRKSNQHICDIDEHQHDGRKEKDEQNI